MFNYKEIANKMKTVARGLEMRPLIVQATESIGEMAENIDNNQKKLDEQFKNLVINEGNSNAEVAASRGSHDWLPDRLDNFDSQLEQIQNNYIEKHKIKYKAVSGTISHDYTITDDEIEIAKRNYLDLTVCVMVSVSSETDENLTLLDDNLVLERLNKIKEKNVNITMLKPHIGLDFSDGFNRGNYDPLYKNLFFINWKNVLLHYAKMCNDYDIPILCLSVEMVNLTKNTFNNYWKDIYKSIKNKYPNLLLIHAPKSWEFIRNDVEESLKWCDILASTFYAHYSYDTYNDTDTINTSELGNAFYNSDLSSFNFMKIVEERCKKYKKQFFFAEIGCMPLNDGLIDVIPPSFSGSLPCTLNHNVQGALYKSFFDNICTNENVCGFSIWHLREPFVFHDGIYSSLSKAEKVLNEYLEGGVI